MDQSEGLAVLLARFLLPLLLTVDIASWCNDGILFVVIEVGNSNQIRERVI